MNPTRRDALALLAGAALAPVAGSAAPAPLTDHETLINAHDALRDIARMPDADPLAISAADLAGQTLYTVIMTLCPHGRETWQFERVDPL